MFFPLHFFFCLHYFFFYSKQTTMVFVWTLRAISYYWADTIYRSVSLFSLFLPSSSYFITTHNSDGQSMGKKFFSIFFLSSILYYCMIYFFLRVSDTFSVNAFPVTGVGVFSFFSDTFFFDFYFSHTTIYIYSNNNNRNSWCRPFIWIWDCVNNQT